ncbi:MAG: hypothetical protein WC655_14215 [Candidatus Hydrogenedentales bacterium]|jgi:hypothetical protein
MLQTYRYRGLVHWASYQIPFVLGLLLAVKCVIYLSVLDPRNPPSDLVMLAIISAVCAFGLLIRAAFGYVSYGYEGACFTLYDNEFVWTNGEEFKYTRYEAVVRIDSKCSKRLGRSRVRIITSDDAFQLSPLIGNAGELVQDLKRELDRRGLQHCYDQEELHSFLKDATIIEQNCERFRENLWRWIALALLWPLTGYVVAVTAGGDTADAIVAAVISFFFSFVPQHVTDRDFVRRIRREANLNDFTCPARDKKWEKRTFRRAVLSTALIYACIYTALIFAARTFG